RRGGVEHIRVDRVVGVVSEDLMHQSAVSLRAQAAMYIPLLEPDSLQGARGDLRDQGEDVRVAEGSKTGLRAGTDIRIAGVQRRVHAEQDQAGAQIGLVQR